MADLDRGRGRSPHDQLPGGCRRSTRPHARQDPVPQGPTRTSSSPRAAGDRDRPEAGVRVVEPSRSRSRLVKRRERADPCNGVHRRREGLSSEINVTPLIDVLLVLLIIFMITQPMSAKRSTCRCRPSSKPRARAAPGPDRARAARRGSFEINGQPYAAQPARQAFHQTMTRARPSCCSSRGGAEPQVHRR